MSLDVDLSVTIDGNEVDVYSANITLTHNLNTMAAEAGIYKHLWRPEEIEIKSAGQLIEPLQVGLEKLKNDPEHYEQFNAYNGCGLYKDLVPWVENYLKACKKFPSATVCISR